jgi:PAS domain S-box-containing protein
MDEDSLTKEDLVRNLLAERETRRALEARYDTAAENGRLLHQLRVHQLELEAQNQALREAQGLLEESRSRYLELYDLAPVAYCTLDRDGVVLEINLAGASMLGKERARIIGKPFLALVRLENPDGFVRHLRNTLEATLPVTSELAFSTAGGPMEVQIVSAAVSPAHGAPTSCRAALLDITLRRSAEREAKLAADRLASAVESVQDAFALFDAGDRLALCNSVYRSLIGPLVSGAIVGRSYEELLDAWAGTLALSDERERALFRSARLAQRHEPGTTFDVRTRDGRSLRIMNRQTPEGTIVETIWDLTEDMRREAQLKQARAAADSANVAKSEFLASMSHELRTPLNAILGFAQLLYRDKKDVPSARHKERIAQILSGGEHLLRLVTDVLDLSRIEAGGLSMSIEPVLISDVLDEVRETLDPAAANAGVRLEITSLADAPSIRADRTRFAQILLNFGSNAIKYNRPNGRVAFRVSIPNSAYVRVTVADTGNGIPFDQQEKLFQPFHRAGQQAGPIEGTGIGLTISKRLAEEMQGHVGFQSVPAQGSEFWVDIPIHIERTASSSRPPSREVATRLGEDRRGRVLYVEDNPANVRLMLDLFASFEGIELITAPTAEIGIAFARAHLPNVIILDINLPGMSGFEALRILRGSPETERIPVIALTATASDKERDRGERLGFQRYLTKPIDVAELEATLDVLLPIDR